MSVSLKEENVVKSTAFIDEWMVVCFVSKNIRNIKHKVISFSFFIKIIIIKKKSLPIS